MSCSLTLKVPQRRTIQTWKQTWGVWILLVKVYILNFTSISTRAAHAEPFGSDCTLFVMEKTSSVSSIKQLCARFRISAPAALISHKPFISLCVFGLQLKLFHKKSALQFTRKLVLLWLFFFFLSTEAKQQVCMWNACVLSSRMLSQLLMGILFQISAFWGK